MSLKSGFSIIFGAVMPRAKTGAILGLSIAAPLGIGGNLIAELGHGNKFKGISTLLSHPSIYLESFITAPLIGGLLGFMSAVLYIPVALVGWFLAYISNRMLQFQWLPLGLYWLAQLLFAAFFVFVLTGVFMRIWIGPDPAERVRRLGLTCLFILALVLPFDF